MERHETGGLINVLSFVTEQAMQMAKCNGMLGEKIEQNGMTIIPVSRFSASFAGGGTDAINCRKKDHQSAGGGAKISLTPVSFLVIRGTDVQVVNVDLPATSVTSDILNAVTEAIANKNGAEE